ncbi:methyl-accepting chemotaxis protein [Alteromonas gilva]|uniref:PAS domain-containing methyl-accepting chemotaxis protein n=1 Tax=Alteromonas gilva TaxID=2987522 RepID=A0ABT5L2V1_9ALTE|nr:PAS domain-containing methyl-accepting chemotaxis protein [Alteromonas gilva]MDC8830167.1 PAS domain-containing methyl-accepting chemotaxis protein [Alteromonas gilva]
MLVSAAKHKVQVTEKQNVIDFQQQLINSINQHVASIEFSPNGTIINASDEFLSLMGYAKNDIIGEHHRIFCVGDTASSPEYQQFWQQLNTGEKQSRTFKRKKANGDIVWLEATYIPVLDQRGSVRSVFKIAYDVTQKVVEKESLQAVSTALDKSMAVIEFMPDGTIIEANQNFLETVGYRLEQIKGQHHRLFCTEEFLRENPNFWASLGKGNYAQGLYERKNSQGDSIWLEASYNPIFDSNGTVTKVVKFASNVTHQVKEKQLIAEAADLSFATAEETAQIAQQGTELLRTSVTASTDAMRDVDTTNGLMQKLNEQSHKIENIVSTIRSIAEQTNLLALNAAIEAARAGDQGRGFAVVADEVRQLASRTSSSTVEIELVVNENKELSQTASGQMLSVKRNVEETNDKIAQVQNVMHEIHVGAVNVSQSVSSILK